MSPRVTPLLRSLLYTIASRQVLQKPLEEEAAMLGFGLGHEQVNVSHILSKTRRFRPVASISRPHRRDEVLGQCAMSSFGQWSLHKHDLDLTCNVLTPRRKG